MERLTYEYILGKNRSWEVHGVDGIKCEMVCRIHKLCDDCPIQKAVNQLAAYENTRLTPEEIAEADKALRESCEIRINRLKEALELIKAKDDGRLVVLLCKPDAVYYRWKRGDNIPSMARFSGVFIDEDGNVHYKAIGEDFQLDDFGKTVFMTYKEAKEATQSKEGES